MNNIPILDIQNVVKRYNGTVAVNHLSLKISKGTIFGFLGPNGAGKTSLIRIITQIIAADEGHVLLDAEPLHPRHSEWIGYMPEERGLYKQMRIFEQLVYLAQLRGLRTDAAKQKVKYWGERLNISGWWNKKVEELSKGMQQLVQFVATVVHEPRLIILDEPFSGLDPINTNRIKEEIYELNKKGATIIFSTHQMEQVEEICESIILINKGTIILEGEVMQVKNQFRKNLYKITYEGCLDKLSSESLEIHALSGTEAVIHPTTMLRPNDLLTLLTDQVEIHSFQEVLPSLNEIFIEQVEQHNNE
jgi:ABC-2 type transport system ATP-binding protein